jgi:protein transport protein SEC39
MMKPSKTLSDAHVVLLAVQAASDSDFDALLQLSKWRPEILSHILLYRLLFSFCPIESSENSSVAKFLKCLGQDPEPADTPALDPSIVNLSQNEAISRCRNLRLQSVPDSRFFQSQSHLAKFVIAWAKRLELFEGTVQPAAEFVSEFIAQDADLQLWYETYMVPVLKLQYEFYPEADNVITLERMEQLAGSGGIRTLIHCAETRQDPASLARDLEEVVAPWVQGANRMKRRKLDTGMRPTDEEDETTWGPLYDWLVTSSTTDFIFSAQTYLAWNGPKSPFITEDDVSRFAQTGMAIVYGCSTTTPEAQNICEEILEKAANAVGLKVPDRQQREKDISVTQVPAEHLYETDLLQNSLLKSSNAFTQVSDFSVSLLSGLLATRKVLSAYDISLTTSELARICIFGSERRHKDELRRLLQYVPMQTRRAVDWGSVRQQVLWLRTWARSDQTTSSDDRTGFFSRLSAGYIEIQVLDALLKAAQYTTIKETYLSTPFAPLPVPEVEDRIVAAIYDAYDNATNGNRDRGGIKRANELFKVFYPFFAESSEFTSIDHLIKATHSLSFYQLTLQHGVPFKPVAIRVQKDPLTLLEKVLEQDSKAYTKVDDLLQIGRNLVQARLPKSGSAVDETEPLELRISHAEHRITYAAIMAALAAEDFDTAYAYITTRLQTSSEEARGSELADDTSWRAAYAAGRYRPSASPKSLAARINSLSQRMELLSRALMLAPSGEALSGILATWRRYEEELDTLKSQAVEEERAFEAKADASLPGAFGMEDREADYVETKRALARRSAPAGLGPSYEEDAPMGLFDVARGAASAFRRSAAFPLSPSTLQNLKIKSPVVGTHDRQREQATSPTSDDGGRVRKRDMVASMVGSGLGWVLGAQPQDRTDYRRESLPE